MATLSNKGKNTATLANQTFGLDQTWEEADFTWGEAQGTWEQQTTQVNNATKNNSTLTNATKN